MDSTVLDRVCQQIYQRFPSVANARPAVSPYGKDQYLLVFSSHGTTPDGKKIQQVVRVVATAEGKILKASLSR